MKNKRLKGNSQLRQLLIRESARLMYEEGITQYFDAKRLAAKRLLGKGGSKTMRFRPQDLPSNGEIAKELASLSQFYLGDSQLQQLFAMRVIALEVMHELEPFTPRLIGSVSTGSIRTGSDIDLHVFTDNPETLVEHLHQFSWRFETKQVNIRKCNKIMSYTHIYSERIFPIELSVYPYQDLRIRNKSSTDGKPIIRIKASQLPQLIMEEHHEYWQHYLHTGELVGIEKTRRGQISY